MINLKPQIARWLAPTLFALFIFAVACDNADNPGATVTIPSATATILGAESTTPISTSVQEWHDSLDRVMVAWNLSLIHISEPTRPY